MKERLFRVMQLTKRFYLLGICFFLAGVAIGKYDPFTLGMDIGSALLLISSLGFLFHERLDRTQKRLRAWWRDAAVGSWCGAFFSATVASCSAVSLFLKWKEPDSLGVLIVCFALLVYSIGFTILFTIEARSNLRAPTSN